MGNKNSKRVTGGTQSDNSADLLTSTLSKPTTRREFLKMAGVGGAGAVALSLVGCATQTAKIVPKAAVFVDNAKMVVMHDASRCVGCRRCEIACTLSHDDKIQTSISRVKLSRNYNFGPEGPRVGYTRGQGIFGNFRLIADTCLQCPHPVPCATACPQGAIEADPKTGARVINTAECVGCQTCLKACPWAMTSFDAEAKKATKCDLCGGDPECVKICPAGALSYVPWRDRSKDVPTRQVVPSFITAAAGVAESCADCHQPVPAVKK